MLGKKVFAAATTNENTFENYNKNVFAGPAGEGGTSGPPGPAGEAGPVGM